MARGPRIKLCGIRGSDDAQAAVQAGADLVGIVLVPGTRRYVPPPTAAAIVRTVRSTATELGRFAPEVVAVVGSMSLAVVRHMVATIDVDAVQLVGTDDECEPIARLLAGMPLIRTINVDPGDELAALVERTERWEAIGARVTYDASSAGGQLGGTGERIDPMVVAPLLAAGARGLAGGLDPDNVADAIRRLCPALVDVSSGIEVGGHKDPERMRAFVAAARAALLEPEALA